MNLIQPTASVPESLRSGEVIVPCRLCAKTIGVPRWDAWNGFILQCPHCRGLHGKPWRVKSTLLAGLLFNALSFFFTMRPRTAAPLLCITALFAIGCNYASDHVALPLALDIVWSSIVGLGPMIINGVILLKHNSLLDKSASQLTSL